MLLNLWARITGKDQRQPVPQQQANVLGRFEDMTVLHPYGLFTDLPNDTIAKQLGDDTLLAMVIKRPTDSARGEVVVFHPETESRIIFRNSGNVEIYTEGNGDVNVISARDVNVQSENIQLNASSNIICNAETMQFVASNSITFDTLSAAFTGSVTVQGGLNVSGVSALTSVTSNGVNVGDTHTHAGSPSAPTGPISNTGIPT